MERRRRHSPQAKRWPTPHQYSMPKNPTMQFRNSCPSRAASEAIMLNGRDVLYRLQDQKSSSCGWVYLRTRGAALINLDFPYHIQDCCQLATLYVHTPHGVSSHNGAQPRHLPTLRTLLPPGRLGCSSRFFPPRGSNTFRAAKFAKPSSCNATDALLNGHPAECNRTRTRHTTIRDVQLAKDNRRPPGTVQPSFRALSSRRGGSLIDDGAVS